MGSDLPEHLVIFIKTFIPTVEQLEILLLFFKKPSRVWTVEQVSEEIRTSLVSAKERLQDLERRGLIVLTSIRDNIGQYQYSANRELHPLVEEVDREYRVRRLRVINTIYTDETPSSVQKMMSFMDAFKLKKEGEDDGT